MTKPTTRPSARKVIVTAALASILIGLTLFIFETFEAISGHGITIASFGATALIVVFNPKSPGASPKAVFFGYILAGVTALFFAHLLSFPPYIMTALVVGVISAIQIYTNMVHPPAVAYSLSFFYGTYGLQEFLFTIPALLSFFIALGVLAFSLEIISSFIFKIEKEEKPAKRNLGDIIDEIIPYSLVLLFISILIEFVNVDFTIQYNIYFSIFNTAIIILFIADLYFKYQKVHNAKQFVKEYWMDIIATIPVFMVMRMLEGVALLFKFERALVTGGAKVTSLSRLLRPMARFPRFAKLIEQMEEVKD